MSTVTYMSGDLVDFSNFYTDWYKGVIGNNSDTFVFSFNEEDFVRLGIDNERHINVIEIYEILLDFVADYNNDNTVITIKYSLINPTNTDLFKWSDDIVKKDGYYYIVATRINIEL